jgi:hypothetical protein
MPIDVSKSPNSTSPLWIIALFIALSEATAGAAAITTNGAARLIFTCFAVAFPSTVFGVFVWLLVRHAPKLYAPAQYSRDITPEVYRLGVNRVDSAVIGRAVAETLVPMKSDDSDPGNRTAEVEAVARRFEAAVDESSLFISLGPLNRSADRLRLPVSRETPVQPVLNEIFYALDGAVAPNSYGKSWMLINDDGTEYTDMGMPWAKQHNLPGDSRTLDEIGIKPGSRLTAVPKLRARQRD